MSFMKADESVSGKEGSLYAKIGDDIYEIAECKSISAKIKKNKTEFKSLGQRATQYKAVGWDGTGTLVIHYATSRFAKLMIDYAKKGVDTYFTLTLTNEDPTSKDTIGKQKVILKDVNFDEAEVAKLDVEAEFLDQSMNFTFSDIDLDTEFTEIHKMNT